MAQKAAWQFLSENWVSFIATDAHNLESRKPCMKAAFKYISIELGEDIANLVCVENPLRILKGQDVIPAKNAEDLISTKNQGR